jgi:hypothetical protein
MKRRKFLTKSMAMGATMGSAAAQTGNPPSRLAPVRPPANAVAAAYSNAKSGYSPFTTPDYYSYTDDLKVERRS